MIYAITSLYVNEDKKVVTRIKCWGYFLDELTAKELIIQNVIDAFQEGYYNYVVVEKLGEGIPGKYNKIAWFKTMGHDGETVKFQEVKEPTFLKRYARFCFT